MAIIPREVQWRPTLAISNIGNHCTMLFRQALKPLKEAYFCGAVFEHHASQDECRGGVKVLRDDIA